jgi:hypothetical protein
LCSRFRDSPEDAAVLSGFAEIAIHMHSSILLSAFKGFAFLISSALREAEDKGVVSCAPADRFKDNT